MDVLKLFRPGIIRNFEGTKKLNYYGMFKYNLKIAWRSAIRQKQFTLLNLLGLTIGIATALTIALYVQNELSYDSFHEKAARIYRVNQPNIWGDWNERASSTGPNVAVALREEAPEFEEVTRVMSQGPQIVRIERPAKNLVFNEKDIFAVEENFFDVFTFNFIAGDKSATSHPNQAVLTEEAAKRYFGADINPSDVIDRSFEVKRWDGSWQLFLVKAIIEDVPSTSHIQFELLVSLKSYQEQMDFHGWKWIWTTFSTYGLVHEGTDIAALEQKIQQIPPKWAAPTTERIFNQSFEDFTDGHPWKLGLQPLNEIYSAGNPEVHFLGPTGNPLFIKIFSSIGVLVLLLSAINFMNLSTARSSTRAKEIGVRKVMGSRRKSLYNQFILESTLFVAVGTFAAIILVNFSLHWFNDLADKELDLASVIGQPFAIGVLIAFVLILGVLSGSYPALYLSSFSPIRVLKGKAIQGFKGKLLRNGLVVFQFTISIGLIICSSFVQKQLSYASTLDLGIDKNNILQIHNIDRFGFDTEVIKNKLASIPAAEKVGKSFGLPPNIFSGDRYKAVGDEQVVQFSNVRTEEDFLDLLGLEFVAGRNFDPSFPTDKYKVIINEAAAKAVNWNIDASIVGKRLALASGSEDEFEVIGVVKDFNFNSLKQEIAPLVVIHHLNDKVWDYGAGRSYLSMRLNPEVLKSTDDINKLILQIEAELAQVDPNVPFEYSFMDQDFERTFRFEQKMGSVLNVFTLIAMIIGCLGLFGLAAFSAEQRIKELSIRKVLGAKISSLVILFSSEFVRLILISTLLAVPLAWLSVDHWLSSFAYRTPVEPWVFIVAISGALVVAVATVSYQSLRVSRKNPAETLKDE